MLEIKNNEINLSIFPYEISKEETLKEYQHIKAWVTFSSSNLKAEFSVEYLAGDLPLQLQDLKEMYHDVGNKKPHKPAEITDIYGQISLTFTQSENLENVGLFASLRPEEDCDGMTLNGGISIDQSYLPNIIHGLESILDNVSN